MKTQDAILMTHAVFNKASNFVTTDQTLIKLGKQRKISYGLNLVSPQRALELMRFRK
jgi:predicted nucleic acid-binding protein